METWKNVPGYEGYYEVSDLGRIRSVDRIVLVNSNGRTFERKLKGRILKQAFDGRGFYLQSNLARDGETKMVLVHRVVALAFLDNPNNLPEVNHKDEDKTNNYASNLEWCSHKYNNNYGTKKSAGKGEGNSQNKFSEEIIKEIKRLYKPRDPNFGNKALSKKYGISCPHISSIVHGKRWGWL